MKLDCKIKTIEQLSSDDNGNLLCKFCQARVSYVSEHIREIKTGQTYVRSCLRLVRSEKHADKCNYKVENQIEQLVADSENFEGLPEPILEKISQKNEKIIVNFRLHILLESFNKISQKPNSLNANNHITSEENIRRDYLETERVLDRYLRTASGVAKLRALVEDNAEKFLKNTIQIIFDTKRIQWRDFYYENEQYLKLFKKCEKAKLNHPIALSLTIKTGPDNKEDRKKKYDFRCFASIKNNDKDKLIIIPRLYTNNPKVVKKISKNNTYIIVAQPHIFNDENNQDNPYRNLYIFLNYPEQIAKVF